MSTTEKITARLIRPAPGAAVWTAAALAVLAWYTCLICEAPHPSSWDAFWRLYHADRLFVSHWLPLPQLPLLLAERLASGLIAIRLTYAIAAACGAVAAGWAAAEISGSRRGGVAVVFAVGLLPAYARHATLPYQEGIFVLFAALFAGAWARGLRGGEARWRWIAAIALALACLCRYEAWLLAAVWAGAELLERRAGRLVHLLPAVAAVAAMIAARALIDAPGDPATEPYRAAFARRVGGAWDLIALTGERLVEIALFAARVLSWPGVVLALIGTALAVRDRLLLGRRLALLLALLAGLALGRAILVVQPNERMLLLPACLGMPLALLALGRLTERLRPAAVRWGIRAAALVAALAVFGANGYARLVLASERFEPEARAAAALAALPGDARVILLPRYVPRESGTAALFAAAPELDTKEKRWITDPQSAASADGPPDYAVYWHRCRYRIKKLSGKQAAGLDRVYPTRREQLSWSEPF